jgi:hypothetical protein
MNNLPSQIVADVVRCGPAQDESGRRVWKAGVSRSFFQIGKRGSANRDFGYANRDPEPRFRNREIQTHIQFM